MVVCVVGWLFVWLDGWLCGWVVVCVVGWLIRCFDSSIIVLFHFFDIDR